MKQPAPTTDVTTVMSLSDIADLARVQRPVVSMWRQRPVARGVLAPFPSPVPHPAGDEVFEMHEVVAWLERTGRGNNPEARKDALAHARPMLGLDDDIARRALEALLCLKARSGLTLSDLLPEEIVDEADEVDPSDDHLVRELLAAGADLTALADHAERLSDALWDAPSAFARVRSTGHRPAPGLGAAALELFGAVGAAVALEAEGDIVITDPLASDIDLLDAVLTRLGEGVVAHVLVHGESTAARAARRLHWARGRSVIDVAPAGVNPLVVTRVPGSRDATDPGALLTTADDIQLDLQEQQRALIVGPAAVLCDSLSRPELDQQRDHFLRLGRLRCVLRLPQGLLADGSRTALSLWLLGSEPESVSVESRRLATADLTNERLGGDVDEDVATDVVASLTDASRDSHAFRYARLHFTAKLLAGSGPIVSPGVGPERVKSDSPASSVVVVCDHLSDLRTQVSTPTLADRLRVAPGSGVAAPAELSIDTAIRAGLLRILPGSRLSTATSTATGVRIIDPQAVRDSSTTHRLVDPLELEAIAPRARRTEPGDVIFCVFPKPAAVVEREGLSVAASPARVLRCAPGSGLVPEAVAQAINDLPAGSPRWRAWRIPRVPVAQAGALAAALQQLTAEQEQAKERAARLSALAHDLARGVSRGALTITDPTEEGL